MEEYIIFNRDTAFAEIEKLLIDYPELKITTDSDSLISLDGRILIYLSYNDFVIRKSYTLEINIPINSKELPYVVDTGNHIIKEYPHRYEDGKLCLSTDSDMRIRFIDGIILSQWMTDYVEPYYFSYEYYQRFGQFPFGERSHDVIGIIETYVDILGAKDELEALKLMKSIKSTKYRGHRLCPCGSKQKVRDCHGPQMLPFYKDSRKMNILFEDFDIIEERIREINEYNRKKAKRT